MCVTLTRRRHPTTDEITYQYFKWTADGNSVSNLFVCARRIEVTDEEPLHTPYGAAIEILKMNYAATFRRGKPGWADEALAWIRARFGDDVAADVVAVLGDPAAFCD